VDVGAGRGGRKAETETKVKALLLCYFVSQAKLRQLLLCPVRTNERPLTVRVYI
jgi:hypothetical protein